jgi:hypothetical protein
MPEPVCPTCGATGRCVEPDGRKLPVGKIHRSRLLKLEGVDCLSCERGDKYEYNNIRGSAS